MRKLLVALAIPACSGEPFTAGTAETPDPPDAEVLHQGDAAPPVPCDFGPLCAPCSGVDRGAPNPDECGELIALLGDLRFVQCIAGKCSFQCETHAEIPSNRCASLEGDCRLPANPSVQAPFCLK